MKKRLLLSLMAMCMGVSSFALSVNEYVYTPQGRFQISGETLVKHDFSNLEGWVSATDGQTLDDVYAVVKDTEAGFWYAQSKVSTAGEGMYLQLSLSNEQTYVVSFKMKGAIGETTRIKNIISTDLVLVQGNADNVYGGTTDVLTANTAEELSEEWQTFSYAIVPDGISRTWFISLTGMATTAQIADLQIAPAYQVADLRQRDVMVEKMEAYKNVYSWDQALLDDYGYDENLENLKAIGDESTQADLDEQLKTCQDVLADFLKENMDDFLAGNAQNYLPMGGKISNSSAGQWTSTTRVYRSANYYYDFGHYVAGGTWMNDSPTQPMGIYMVQSLSKGSYVFSIDAAAAVREGTSSNGAGNWDNNDGLHVGYAVLYIKKAADGDHVNVTKDDAESCVAFKTYDVSPNPDNSFTPGIVSVQIPEEGDYEFGIMVYCKEQYQSRKNGSVTYLYNAQMWGKTDNEYNVAQLNYEADVREQITTGRNALTTAAEYLANAEKYWGKAELQACVDTIETKIAAYELLTQDDIIATYDKDLYNHDNRVKNADEGLLVFEVYDTATRHIIAANRKFLAVNDTLESLQKTIDLAEATLKERIYDAATGKADLQAAIVVAKGVQTTMKAGQYSEENAADIVAANKTLNEAIETFKASIPAEAIAEIMSLDFEKAAVAGDGVYTIDGNNTVMTIANFATETPTAESDNAPFELGFDKNAEKVLPGVLRVGNGEAVATIPTFEAGNNILKVSMDFWFLRVTNGYNGFYMNDENGERVAGWYWCQYSNSYDTAGMDDFGIATPGDYSKSNTTGDDASCEDGNKTHIEAFLDYGQKSMYVETTTTSGMKTSEKVYFKGTIPTTFIVKGDYSNRSARYRARRSWFDNLKMEVIKADATEPFVEPSGIQEINTNENKVVAPSKMFKNGRIIINGKYGINGMLVK